MFEHYITGPTSLPAACHPIRAVPIPIPYGEEVTVAPAI